MLVSRQLSTFSKVTIFLLFSWSLKCDGISKWHIGQENPLLKGYYNDAFKLHNLLKELSVEDIPEAFLNLYNDMIATDSEDIDDKVQATDISNSAFSPFWDEMNTESNKDNRIGETDTVSKRNDLNSICRKGNVFGSWLVRLCNERRSVK